MFLYVFLILVTQICYCSACASICGVTATAAVFAIGITMSLMLITIIALSVIVHRLRQRRNNDKSMFRNKHVSTNKYIRQFSGNSDRSIVRLSTTESMELENENKKCDDMEQNISYNRTNNIAAESKNEILQKVLKKPQVSILGLTQMREICEGVLSKTHTKQSTSLTDLDKIINDAKMDCVNNAKKYDITASTPALDVYNTVPSSLAMDKVLLNENHISDRINESLNHGDRKITVSDELSLNFNQTDASRSDEIHGIELNQDSDVIHGKIKNAVILDFDNRNNMANLCPSEQSKALHDDLKEKLNQVANKSKINKSKIQSKVDNPDGSSVEAHVPDIPEHEVYDSVPSQPSRSVIRDEMYDCVPSKPLLSEGKIMNDLYDCALSQSIIVTVDDDAGYLSRVCDGDVAHFVEPQYSNAKIPKF